MKKANYIFGGIVLVITFLVYYSFYRTSKNLKPCKDNLIDTEHIDRPEAPDERRAFEIMKRGGSINPAKVEIARRKMRKMVKAAKPVPTRDGGIGGWSDLGPKNVGGRIRAVVINPNNANEIFIGAAAGGVWRSVDGGTNWTLRNPSVQAYPVTDIAYDPFDNDIMYATTGEYRGGGPEFPGVGVLKSINGGDTWNILPSPVGANFLWLSKVRMNPLLQNSLFVAGTTGDIEANSNRDGAAVLYRSNDGGQTWVTTWISGISDFIYDLEMNPNDTSELIIGLNGVVRLSSNSGTSFVSQMGNAPNISLGANTLSRRCEVEYCDNDPNTIYVSRYTLVDANGNGGFESRGTELWRTQNGGGNWARIWNVVSRTDNNTGYNVNPLNTQGGYSHALWVDPSNCNRALIGGINLWKWQNNNMTQITDWRDDINGNSTTSGTNNSVHADFHAIVEDPGYDGSSNSKVWLGNDGGIYGANNIWTASLNSGWFAQNTELRITQLYGADISWSGDTIIGGSQDNSYFFDVNSSNGADFWNVYSTGDGGFCSIKKSNTNIIYATTQNGSVYQTDNGGSTFCATLRLDGGNAAGCCNCAPFTTQNDSALFIAPFKIDPNFEEFAYMGGKQLWRGMNDGLTWGSIKPKTNPNPANETNSISAIDIAIGDILTDLNISKTLWVGHADGQVYQTSSGGFIWNRVDGNGIGLPDRFITDIAIHPLDPDKVMVTLGGFENDHIFLTEDGGLTWIDRGLGFDIHVATVTWHPTIDDWVYVGTDVGMFASHDNGLTWSVDPLFTNSEGPVYTRVSELFWQGNGSTQFPYYLCAATFGRGLWRSNTPIIREMFVDRNCSPCGLGTANRPFQTFREAFNRIGPGSRVVFLTGGIYEEGAPAMLIDDDVEIVKANGVQGSVIIK